MVSIVQYEEPLSKDLRNMGGSQDRSLMSLSLSKLRNFNMDEDRDLALRGRPQSERKASKGLFGYRN